MGFRWKILEIIVLSVWAAMREICLLNCLRVIKIVELEYWFPVKCDAIGADLRAQKGERKLKNKSSHFLGTRCAVIVFHSGHFPCKLIVIFYWHRILQAIASDWIGVNSVTFGASITLIAMWLQEMTARQFGVALQCIQKWQVNRFNEFSLDWRGQQCSCWWPLW